MNRGFVTVCVLGGINGGLLAAYGHDVTEWSFWIIGAWYAIAVNIALAVGENS